MACGSKEAGGAHGPRHPQQTPFNQRVERFFPQFEGVYEERYPERYGFWRPVCAEVPHRQFVFTIPKRLRIYFRFERRLLGDPAGAHARQDNFMRFLKTAGGFRAWQGRDAPQ